MSERNTETVRAVEAVLPGETATARAAHESLKGERRGIPKLWPFLGPAFTAAVVVTLIVSLNVFLLYQTFSG
jgi:hypothetical protein